MKIAPGEWKNIARPVVESLNTLKNCCETFKIQHRQIDKALKASGVSVQALEERMTLLIDKNQKVCLEEISRHNVNLQMLLDASETKLYAHLN